MAARAEAPAGALSPVPGLCQEGVGVGSLLLVSLAPLELALVAKAEFALACGLSLLGGT